MPIRLIHMKYYTPLSAYVLAAFGICVFVPFGCSRRSDQLEVELARLQKENRERRRQLEEVAKLSEKMEGLLDSYDEMAPQISEIQSEIDSTRDYISKIEALTPAGINERGRAELKLLIEEVIAEDRQRRRAEHQEWAADLRQRHIDELASLAHLSPEQKGKLSGYLKQELEQVNSAYSQFAQGLARMEDIKRAKEDARIEKEKKVKSLLAPDQDVVVGMGNSVPLAWAGSLDDLPEEGWDWAFAQSVQDHAAGRQPTLQCALQIALPPASQGQGISRLMVQAMRAIGAAHGFNQLIAPVRPSQKSRYPLTSIDRYVEWTTDEGLPFDPWLRVHEERGGRQLGVLQRSLTVRGTVREWEQWAGMNFPRSGEYIVEDALVPVAIERERNVGEYVEPNVWYYHETA